MADDQWVLALDSGTTSCRAILFDREGDIHGIAQRELRQIYPHPGWVEHDPEEIAPSQLEVVRDVLERNRLGADSVAAIGIPCQRETAVVWEPDSGRPLMNAIVWQDRRTAGICDDLKARGLTEQVRRTTGLLIDAYFSGTKIKWMLDNNAGARERARRGELLFGTVDSWLIWNLTGGRVHVTDYSNASRTMLLDIQNVDWDDALLSELEIPRAMLPELRPSSEIYAYTDPSHFFGRGLPIASAIGDQYGALFGQSCLEKGMVKATYGTGGAVAPGRAGHYLQLRGAGRACPAGRGQQRRLPGARLHGALRALLGPVCPGAPLSGLPAGQT